MLRHAKIRIVGTIAAIPLSALWFATATSQTVTNDQSQAGNVFSSQTLDVVTASSDTTATTTSTGNSFTGSVVTGDLAVTSTQSASNNVQAQTVLNVTTDAGPSTSLFTAATGNTGTSVISGGGTLSGSYNQSIAAPANTNCLSVGGPCAPIDGESQIEGPNATTADLAMSVQAIANSQTFGTSDSALNVSVTQTNASIVAANGGAILGDVSDQGSFSSIGAGNNVTSTTSGVVSQTLGVTQTNDGAITQGTEFVNLGSSEVTNTSATATGNNISATNTQGPLSVSDNQDNESYVRAQSVETSFAFGGANVSAYGVGNSVMAGNQGPSTVLNNVQVNGAGGVESIASFGGDNGFDAFVSSTAIGNSATGFACSSCGGVMNVTNSQTNNGDASATASVALTNGARSVRSTATAVGNSGTFYVSTPGQ
jgi:hypothetical protein